MNDRVIRPSMKQVKAWYAFAVLLIVVAVVVQAKYLTPRDQPPWLPAVSVLILFIPIRRHIRRQTIKVTITGDKLRYESGLLSKTTRNIQLSKVQDVRVDQSLGQRMMGVGDLSIETSGESSRLEVDNIDAPQAVADEIIAASQEHGSTQSGGGRP
ncbi:MAG: PH domain-containing protein [Acidobacteriia bacterium]|nr:PH domain-containing protein [Terriglobia bacterium]